MSDPLLIYLAGAIEATDDLGHGWRKDYRKSIESLRGYTVFIPGESEDTSVLKKYKDLAEKNIIEFKKQFHENIVDIDLEALHLSDLIIVKYEGEQTVGTIDEVCTAFRSGIPIFMVTSLPVRKINCWLLAHTTELFKTKEELLHKLK